MKKESVVKKLKKRLLNPQLNLNFNNEVNKKREVSEEEKENYEQTHEAFQAYKKEKKK